MFLCLVNSVRSTGVRNGTETAKQHPSKRDLCELFQGHISSWQDLVSESKMTGFDENQVCIFHNC